MREVFENIVKKLKDWTFNADVIMPNEEQLNNRRLIASENAIEIVKQEAEQHNNGWIPCSERLPEENSNVIACFAHGLVTALTFYDGLFHGIYEYTTRVIIAWQHLPAPYQPSEIIRKKTNFDRCCESIEAMAQIIDIAKIGWTKEQIMEWLQSESEK